ncbi:hypothetical protein L3C95_13200 [Chitinophaga filiformis]|uniref:hypothetical protein n=1 Tax=Chitinophaga filiformis TaxID=104663 RepID=UPI001F480AA2|nr:hypothetical protein [Chitinophaga filiformis]MCF6403842.1 hypothetical protein [Chitinophaga filiformis]
MKIALRNQYLSTQRFSRYLIATGNNNRRAKRLYAANIRLAQAFHPMLSQLEVVFRNALNATLSAYFNDPDWIINQKNGFMSHPSLARSKFFLRSCIQKTEYHLQNRSIPVTAGKIISDQMFGFWAAFFVPHHYTLIRGQPIYVFPNKPAKETRASIHQKLEEIKNYRNRMNHCEPLCFNANTVDCTNALAIRSMIYELIEWIDPELKGYFQSIDTIQSKTARIMLI